MMVTRNITGYIVSVFILANIAYAQTDGVRLRATVVDDTVDQYERIWVNLEITNESNYNILINDCLQNIPRRLYSIASVYDSLDRRLHYEDQIRSGRLCESATIIEKNSTVIFTLYVYEFGVYTLLGHFLPQGRYRIRNTVRYRIHDREHYNDILKMHDDVYVVVNENERCQYSAVIEYCTDLEKEWRQWPTTEEGWEEYRKIDSEHRQRICDSLRYLQMRALRTYFIENHPAERDYDISGTITFKAYSLKEYDLIIDQLIRLYYRHHYDDYVFDHLWFYQIPFTPAMVEKYKSFMECYIEAMEGKQDRNAAFFKELLLRDVE